VQQATAFIGGNGILRCGQVKKNLAIFNNNSVARSGEEFLERACEEIGNHARAVWQQLSTAASLQSD
jgi:hypothetical protein